MSASHGLIIGDWSHRINGQSKAIRYIYYATKDGNPDPSVLRRGEDQVAYWQSHGGYVMPVPTGTCALNLYADNLSVSNGELWNQNDEHEKTGSANAFWKAGGSATDNEQWSLPVGWSIQCWQPT